MKTIKDTITSVANALGWTVHYHDPNNALFTQTSPAGEDFSFEVSFKNEKELAQKIVEFCESFDVNEHVEMWAAARLSGREDVPNLYVLCEDASDIADMLITLSEAINDINAQSKAEAPEQKPAATPAQALMAIWKYDRPPYYLGGEIERILPDGKVVPVGYNDGYCFEPVKILPLDKMKLRELEMMSDEYTRDLRDLGQHYKGKAELLFGI